METKTCKVCKKNKNISEFYLLKRRVNGKIYENYRTECRKCFNKMCHNNSKLIRHNTLVSNKQYAVNKLGGKCQICGYNKSLYALDFHHVDRNKKQYRISTLMQRFSVHLLDKELEKCILLCSNCHREMHGGVLNPAAVNRITIS